MRVRVSSAVAAFLVACSGSSPTPPGGGTPIPCSGDAGCPDGQICAAGLCTRTSTDGRQPTLFSTTPAVNDQNVWVGAPIQATFSEPMRLGDGDASLSLQLLGGGEVPKTLELSPDGRTLTIHAPDLAGPADLTVRFWSGFTDLSGLPVATTDAYRWQFRCPLWQSPGGFYPQPGGQYGVDSGAVAVDSLGRGVAAYVWSQSGLDQALHVDRWEGSAWNAIGDADPGAEYVSGVRLAARGDAVVLAYSHAPPNASGSTVEVTTLRSDAWTAFPSFSVLGGGSQIRLAVGPDLAPVIAWQDSGLLHALRWSPAVSAWQPLVDVASPSGGSIMYLGDLRVDAAGVTHAAFFDWTGVDGNVWVVQWKEGSADPLGGPATSSASGSLTGPSLAFDEVGRPLVAYETRDGGFGVSRLDGSAWATTLAVPAAGSAWRLRPSLAVDPVHGLFVGVETGSTVGAWHDDGSGWVSEEPPVIVPFPGSVTFLGLADGAGLGPWVAYQPGTAFNVLRYNRQ